MDDDPPPLDPITEAALAAYATLATGQPLRPVDVLLETDPWPSNGLNTPGPA